MSSQDARVGGMSGSLARALRRSAGSIPLMSRRAYRIELLATFFISLSLACVDSGVAGVIVKQTFTGTVSPGSLGLAVAIVGAALEIANIISFFWTQASMGRPKVAFIHALQVGMIGVVGLLALIPRTPAGLWILVTAVLLARVFWSGVLTIRTTIWRANFPREVRAGVVGRLSVVQVIIVAAMGVTLGSWMDRTPNAFRVVLPAAAVMAGVGTFVYSRLRVRREWRLLREERANPDAIMPPWMGPVVVTRVLRKDRDFARFMAWMFLLGWGNLMLPPVLIITLKDQFDLSYLPSILLSSAIPQIVTSLAVPLWARLLNRAHIVAFRAVHGWAFVVATALYASAAWFHSVPLLFVAAVVQGIGFGGGALAWNIGHVDFAPPAQTSQYMATHVTLNGLRGLLAPFFAVGLYQELLRLHVPHAAAIVLLFSTVLCVVGTLGFRVLARQMGSAGRTPMIRGESGAAKSPR